MFVRSHFLLAAGIVAAASALAPQPLAAQEVVKIGLIVPMTGGQASTGKQIDNAVKLYMQQHGDTVAGKKIEVILKDDATLPDNTKRLAQELIVNDKVSIIAGMGVTPKPAMILTLSLTMSSCARRLVLSGSVASSLRMTSIFLPATVLPCCCM